MLKRHHCFICHLKITSRYPTASMGTMRRPWYEKTMHTLQRTSSLPANYMFRNGYHLWYCSHILYSNGNSSSLSLSTCTPSHLPFLNCKLPEQSVVVLCQNFLRSARGWGDPTFSGLRIYQRYRKYWRKNWYRDCSNLGCLMMRLVLRYIYLVSCF